MKNQCISWSNPIPLAQYDDDEEWVQEYKEQFGEEPTFF